MARKARAAERRILLVEDEYFVAVEVAQALEDNGIATVDPTGSVREAFELIEDEGTIDAAILDINLRGQTVYPLAEALEAKKVPFVFATGYGPQAIPARFQHMPRFEKPLDLELLVKAVAR